MAIPAPKPIGRQTGVDNAQVLGVITDPLERAFTDATLQDVERFSNALTSYIDTVFQGAEAQRTSNNFDTRFQRNNRRAEAYVKVTVNGRGEVDLAAEDGHAEIGLNQGWSRSAMLSASSTLFFSLFQSHSRPFKMRGRGQRLETRDTLRISTCLLDDLLDRADLNRHGAHLTREMPKQGTAVLRYQMSRKVKFQRDDGGVWRESFGPLEPDVTLWPLENVYVTNYDRLDAADQEGVFWVRPSATVRDLEPDEAKFGPSSDGRQMLLSGKYVNLDVLRKQMVGRPTDGASHSFEGRTAPSSVSVFPRFDVFEFEGSVPLSLFADKGLTPDVAEFFGIDVGMDPTMGGEAEQNEWLRRLDRITQYTVTYAVPREGGGSSGSRSGRVLLQCEPCRTRAPRNSLYKFVYAPDGCKFLGMSVVDLGNELEKCGDALRNSQVWATWRNHHPNALVDGRVLGQRGKETLQKLLTGVGQIVDVGKFGVSPEDAVKYLTFPIDSRLDGWIASLKAAFDNTVGVKAEIQGTPGDTSSSTLGEVQLNRATGRALLDYIALVNAPELVRLYTDMLDDYYYFMGLEGKDALYSDLARITGLNVQNLDRVLAGGVEGPQADLVITHPLSLIQDPTVTSTLMLRLFQLVGVAMFTDPMITRFTQQILEMNGVMHSEELLAGQYPSMDPGDEMRQLAQGNWVEPQPNDDHLRHIQSHKAVVDLLAQIEAQYPDLSALNDSDVADIEQATHMTIHEVRNLMELLPLHLDQTAQMLMMQMGMQQMQAGGGGGGGNEPRGVLEGQGGPAGGGGGQQNAGVETQTGGMAPLEQNTNPTNALGQRRNIEERSA